MEIAFAIILLSLFLAVFGPVLGRAICGKDLTVQEFIGIDDSTCPEEEIIDPTEE